VSDRGDHRTSGQRAHDAAEQGPQRPGRQTCPDQRGRKDQRRLDGHASHPRYDGRHQDGHEDRSQTEMEASLHGREALALAHGLDNDTFAIGVEAADVGDLVGGVDGGQVVATQLLRVLHLAIHRENEFGPSNNIP